MNKKSGIKPAGKIGIGIVIVLVAYFGLYKTGILDKMALSSSGQCEYPEGVAKNTPCVRIGVVTWGGYAAGQYFNNGFKANKGSRYFKDYGFLVEFIVLDDFEASRAAWKSDNVDLMWVTADAYPTETYGLREHKPKLLFQADWSRGGDAIVVTRSIKNVNDLKGKNVTVAEGTPSHTFLIQLLEAGGLTMKDINLVKAATAIDAAGIFKAGKADAAVVWSPDDQMCIENVPGAKVLKSTKTASHIIADGFFAKASYIKKNKDTLQNLIEGWMIGASEINTNRTAKKKAIVILSEGLQLRIDEAKNAINNVRLATIGDNVNFFNLNPSYSGVTGGDLYTKMTTAYKNVGFIDSDQAVPNWRAVTDSSIISKLQNSTKLNGNAHRAEGSIRFKTISANQLPTSKATAHKSITVQFAANSYRLGDNAKTLIDLQVGEMAKSFAGSRIRVEGNTAYTGSAGKGIAFSKLRALSVVNYLSRQYKFDKRRFVVVGNGSTKMKPADYRNAKALRKNRKTDFYIY